jgi:RHS repeat-associated protein
MYFQRTDSAGPAGLLSDALGSTIALTRATGNTLAPYTYEPFGNTTITGSSANPYQYTARENDGTGVYFYRGRYYNPTFQRFISEDPIGIAGGVNLYAYTGNNPISFRDPFGTDKRGAGWASAVGHYLWNNFANCGGVPVCGTGLPGPLGLAAGAEAAAEEAAEAAAATGNNAIDVSSNAFDHVIDTHTAGGASATASKSIFSGDAQDIANLVQNSQTTNGIAQANGNTAFVNYAGNAVGYSSTGQYTNVYTVIVNSNGGLVTAFPGFPRQP